MRAADYYKEDEPALPLRHQVTVPMPQRPVTLVKKSCLAAAVAALALAPSACSTVPSEGDEGLVGTIADAGSRTWDRTKYLLGFGPDARAAAEVRRAGEEEPPLDEVDLALMEEDAPAPETSTGVVESDEWTEITAEGSVDAEPLDDEMLLVGADDLAHEVTENETLWDIAKATTGDATNWHVLADVNDLEPDAAVYPGQTLRIPADLVRPELAGGAPDAIDDAPAERLAIPETDEAVPVIDEASAETLADAEPSGPAFEIRAGETLWDFAKRTTGDATNWQAIAEANGFDEREAVLVREGQSVSVPESLLREATAASATAAEAVSSAPGDAALERPTEMVAIPDAPGEDGELDASIAETRAALTALAEKTAPEGAATTAADAAAGGDASAAVVVVADGAAEAIEEIEEIDAPVAAEPERSTVRIVEAAYRSDDAATTNATEASALAGLPDEIMVSGTYYPKAVYNDADFSSSLLMRVSPGTTLQVSRAVGPWFEVETDRGMGYVHERDIK